MSESGLAEAGRTIEEDMFRRMPPLPSGRKENMEIIFDVFLSNIVVPAVRTEGLV
jgi:hypothetical protein